MWLVVTRIEAGNSCHMAVVEGAFPNANIKARELEQRLFKCDQLTPRFVTPAKAGAGLIT